LPHGIRQGALGDCWFLAAASALAEHPERLKKVIKNTEYPAEGIFKFDFFLAGTPTHIVIDDRLPAIEYSPTNKKPLYA